MPVKPHHIKSAITVIAAGTIIGVGISDILFIKNSDVSASEDGSYFSDKHINSTLVEGGLIGGSVGAAIDIAAAVLYVYSDSISEYAKNTKERLGKWCALFKNTPAHTADEVASDEEAALVTTPPTYGSVN